jgi:ATP-dependent Clp protease ATP-binding subunit ClpA
MVAMPSSENRRRIEVPVWMYDRLKRIADAEDRTVTNVLQELLYPAVQNYRPAWVPREHLDRFTPPARRVLELAEAAPAQFNHNYVGTEHLLLALVEEGGGLAARTLLSRGVTPERVRERIVEIVKRGERPVPGRSEYVPRMRAALGLAVEEARRLGHAELTTGHMLLGLLGAGQGIGARILAELGVTDISGLRRDVTEALPGGEGEPAASA